MSEIVNPSTEFNSFIQIHTAENIKIRSDIIKKILETQVEIEEYFDFYLQKFPENNHTSNPDIDNAVRLIKTCKSNTTTMFIEINELINRLNENEINFKFLKILDMSLTGIVLPYKNPEDKGNLLDNLYRIEAKLRSVVSYLNDYVYNFKNLHNLIFDNYKVMFKEAETEFIKFKELKNTIENQKAEAYYSTAENDYNRRYERNRLYFFMSIGTTALISFLLMLFKNRLDLEVFDYWFVKVSVIIIGITFISYFLKQSSHYQKLADQCKITRLELEAFPSFTSSLNGADISDIRKELALKYFGREIDSSIQKDVSNLVSDQMKSTTEMVKAATELFKKSGNQ